MKELVIYLIKSGLCLSIFLLIYRLFMRSTTFFKLNRIFLISGLVISFLIPAIHYTYEVIDVTPLTVTPVDEKELTTGTPTMSKVSELDVDYSKKEPVVKNRKAAALMIKMSTVWTIIFIILVSVAGLLILRSFVAYSRLAKLIKQGKKTKYQGYTLIDTPIVQTPFTTFNIIFADMEKISTDEVKSAIFKHEIVHIKQRHWLDLLLCEMALMLQWFNPVMWLYARYLRENHEFLADKGVLAQGISPTLYRAALVNERLQGDAFSFASPFNGAASLGRLSMMKKEKTSGWKKVLALTIFPLLGIFLWFSAEPNFLMINLDSLSVKFVGEIMTVDKDGYPVQNGINAKEMLLFPYISSYENVIPESLRSSKLNLYAKLGKEGMLVVQTKANSNGISNTELIDKVCNLSDVVIIIDKNAAEAEDLKNLKITDIKSVSYLLGNKMYSQEGDKIMVSQISDYGVDTPALVKTDNFEIAECANMSEILSKLDNPLVVINGKTSSVNKLKAIKLKDINVLSIFTKQKYLTKYGPKAKGGVMVVLTTDVSS